MAGAYRFFDAGNFELMVKMLNACSVNGRFWFYAADLTDVRVTLGIEAFQCTCELCGH